MAVSDIGHNYAGALIEALRAPEEIQKAGQDLEAFAALLREVPALLRVLEHPGIAAARRRELLDKALAPLEPLPPVRRLLHIVVGNGRLRQAAEIAEAFAALRDARLDVEAAEVVTAVPLDAAARAEWERSLARLAGRSVRVAYRADASLVGGARTRLGSVVFDGSLKRQLARIRGVLLGGGA